MEAYEIRLKLSDEIIGHVVHEWGPDGARFSFWSIKRRHPGKWYPTYEACFPARLDVAETEARLDVAGSARIRQAADSRFMERIEKKADKRERRLRHLTFRAAQQQRKFEKFVLVLRLRAEGKKFDEIGRELGISAGHASILHRRAALRERFWLAKGYPSQPPFAPPQT
jgi:hypothetical protein